MITILFDALGDSSLAMLEACARMNRFTKIYLVDDAPYFDSVFERLKKRYAREFNLQKTTVLPEDVNFRFPTSQLRDKDWLRYSDNNFFFPEYSFFKSALDKEEMNIFLGDYSVNLYSEESFRNKISCITKPRILSGGCKGVKEYPYGHWVKSTTRLVGAGEDEPDIYCEEKLPSIVDEFGEYEYVMDLVIHEGNYSCSIRRVYRMKGGSDTVFRFIGDVPELATIYSSLKNFLEWFSCKVARQGIFNIQFKEDNGAIKIFDLNIRSSGGAMEALSWFNPVELLYESEFMERKLQNNIVYPHNRELIFRYLKEF